MLKIDINADMGEGFGNYKIGNDEELMKYITSASVACGFHAGDPCIMKRTVELAKRNGVAVGAHPGLPDILGFGRREMKISSEDAECYTTYQIGALKAFLKMYDMKLHHVKPHGAFFVMATKDEDLAEAFVNSVKATAPEAMMLLPAPLTYPLALKGQKAGIRIIGQLYPDLTYNPDGSQIIERVKKSVDPPQVCEKVLRFLREKKVKAILEERDEDDKDTCHRP
jgi:UPF0271 protein